MPQDWSKRVLRSTACRRGPFSPLMEQPRAYSALLKKSSIKPWFKHLRMVLGKCIATKPHTHIWRIDFNYPLSWLWLGVNSCSPKGFLMLVLQYILSRKINYNKCNSTHLFVLKATLLNLTPTTSLSKSWVQWNLRPLAIVCRRQIRIVRGIWDSLLKKALVKCHPSNKYMNRIIFGNTHSQKC